MFAGCGATYHKNRAIHHYNKAKDLDSTFALMDTFKTTVPVVVPEVRVDTLMEFREGDTVYIEKERLKIKIINFPGERIEVEGECETDTIYQEVMVPYEVLVREESYRSLVKRWLGINELIFWVLHIGLILIGILLILRRVKG
jgi:hypothetical protein